jgi:hypothetical protein
LGIAWHICSARSEFQMKGARRRRGVRKESAAHRQLNIEFTEKKRPEVTEETLREELDLENTGPVAVGLGPSLRGLYKIA